MWDWELNCCVWLERVLFKLAGSALDSALKLSLEKIYDYRLVPLQMQLPICVCFLLVSAFEFGYLDILLVLDTVDILMDIIEQLGEKLGRVVLVIPLEHDAVAAEDFLEGAWIDIPKGTRFVPHAVI